MVNNNIDSIWNIYTFDELLKKYTISDILSIFYHCYLPSINLPQPTNNIILYKISDFNIDLTKFNNNHNEAYFKPDSLVLQDLKYIFYLPKEYYKDNIININFITENIRECSINLYDICLAKKWDKYSFNLIVENNNFIIKQELNNGERVDIVVEFLCKTYVDIGGKIKFIENI